MALDPRRHSRRQRPVWLPFLFGNLTGALIASVVFWFVWFAEPTPGTSSATANAPSAPITPTAEPGIDFEYEQELQTSEVPVQIDAVETAQRPTQRAGDHLMLQAGSFRSAAEADRLRVTIMTLGLGTVEAREVRLTESDIWHRVLVGPFNDDAELRKAQDRLAEAEIQAFPVSPPPAASSSLEDTVPRDETSPSPQLRNPAAPPVTRADA